MSLITLNGLAAILAAAPVKVVHRGRGVTAKHVDRATAAAKSDALASWTTYGRGEAGSAGTMRGRMSRDKSKVLGFIMADGDGVFQAEHGTSSRAADPVMEQAAEGVAAGWAEDMADMAEDVI